MTDQYLRSYGHLVTQISTSLGVLTRNLASEVANDLEVPILLQRVVRCSHCSNPTLGSGSIPTFYFFIEDTSTRRYVGQGELSQWHYSLGSCASLLLLHVRFVLSGTIWRRKALCIFRYSFGISGGASQLELARHPSCADAKSLPTDRTLGAKES